MRTQQSSTERSTLPTMGRADGILHSMVLALREPIRGLVRRVALLAGVLWLP